MYRNEEMRKFYTDNKKTEERLAVDVQILKDQYSEITIQDEERIKKFSSMLKTIFSFGYFVDVEDIKKFRLTGKLQL